MGGLSEGEVGRRIGSVCVTVLYHKKTCDALCVIVCVSDKSMYDNKNSCVCVCTILPNVMSPTRAVCGMRLRESCRDSCQGERDRERGGREGGGGERGRERGEGEGGGGERYHQISQ